MSGGNNQGGGFPHRHVSVQIAMARDWAGICQRRATELLGTPEAAELLAHSKRYSAMADTLAALSREATVTTAYLDAARTALRKAASALAHANEQARGLYLAAYESVSDTLAAIKEKEPKT